MTGQLESVRRSVAICLCCMATGCASNAVQTRTVEVKVPVAIQPIKPASPAAALDMLLSDHCKWVAYGLLTDPLLRVSSGQLPQALPSYPECER
jgi:hypothetical protein